MLDAGEIDRIADELVGARRDGALIRPPARSIGAAEAYRIQDAVARRLGPVAGWKVGAKSRQAVPTCAPLLSRTVVRAAGNVIVAVRKRVGVEVEIAYELGRAFGPSSRPPSADDVLSAVASTHIAVELCAARWATANEIDPAWLLADNQMNEALIVGVPLQDAGNLGFEQLEARLLVDGNVAVHTTGGHPARDPQRLLVWLVRHCVAERGGLPDKAVVTTGSWTGMHFAEPGQQVTAELTGLGQLSLILA